MAFEQAESPEGLENFDKRSFLSWYSCGIRNGGDRMIQAELRTGMPYKRCRVVPNNWELDQIDCQAEPFVLNAR